MKAQRISKWRYGALLLGCILLMTAGTSLMTFAEEDCPSAAFTDLDTTQWYHAETDYVLKEGLMKGTGSSTFEPNATTTRAMIVTILYRLEGEPAADASGFTDVTSGSWYEAAVSWGEKSGIVKGVSDTSFAPNVPITREQLATLLFRYSRYKGFPLGDPMIPADLFDDLEDISEYATDSVPWAIANGLMKGVSEKRLEPKGTATRAQVAVMLKRLLGTPKERMEAVYLGVKDYGQEQTNKDNKNDFLYRFRIDGKEQTLKVDNKIDANGTYQYTIQNLLKEGYSYEIVVEDGTVISAEEIQAETVSYTPPVQGVPGELTVKNFLKTGLEPVGTALYIYGGGWDWQDVGSSNQARTLGVSPDWVRFFNAQDANYTYKDPNPLVSYYPFGEYNEYYYAGLDCSGFLGWAIYNTFETQNGQPGYVGGAAGFAKRLAAKGWGEWTQDSKDMKPGDVVSIKGHVWVSLGTCSDGSIVLLHCTPSRSRADQPGGGVQISAIGTSTDCEAYRLADQYMSRYFPTWYERYPIYLCDPDVYLNLEGENPGRFRWNATGENGGLTDPEGLQNMAPAEVLAELFR